MPDIHNINKNIYIYIVNNINRLAYLFYFLKME